MNTIDKQKIKKEAKQIMDNFMNALKDIEVEEEFVLERESCFRDEKNGNEKDKEFQQKFLNNAPKIRGTAIVTNKGDWTK